VQILETPLHVVPGVIPKKAALLRKDCGIETVGDLLTWYPFRYIDRTKVYTIREINEDLPYIQLVGKLEQIKLVGKEQKKQRLSAILRDSSGIVELIWFQGIKYVQDKLRPGMDFLVFGKPTNFHGTWNIPHPDIEPYAAEKAAQASKLQPVYSSSEAMKRAFLESKGLSAMIQNILRFVEGRLVESVPLSMRKELNLIGLEDAFRWIHQPSNPDQLKKAEQRLKFEELFFLQIRLIRQNLVNKRQIKGFAFESIGNYFNTFYNHHMPFQLTQAQKRVIKEVRADVARPIQMNRLVQGDVGSGKTIVAFMSMLMALDNGFQACLMAPTEILAQQHYLSLGELARAIGVNIRLLTGSSKTKERREIHQELEEGTLHILVGTHALLEDKVKFHNLGFVVIDEQHRFGVAQRAKLWAKNHLPPHVLIMSATPIPRTLAMTLYGDLDVSVIDELPPGRKPIKTMHRYESERPVVLEFLKKEIALGRQVYFVYPLIEESEQMDYRNLFEGYEHLVTWFPAPKYHLSIVHGRLKPADKEFEMQRFVKRETQIMVATTVIEVGVNVPNASVMVIESAERFGLSQLHQLRGRVGRGADQSYCMMITGVKLSSDARIRLKTMTETNDGFKIAEVDLRLRGPGDLQGTQQSGTLDLKLADLSRDASLIAWCREQAMALLDRDPNLELEENHCIKEKLMILQSKQMNWGRIS
jgi:ATP-dependent DNA helicase RecG